MVSDRQMSRSRGGWMKSFKDRVSRNKTGQEKPIRERALCEPYHNCRSNSPSPNRSHLVIHPPQNFFCFKCFLTAKKTSTGNSGILNVPGPRVWCDDPFGHRPGHRSSWQRSRFSHKAAETTANPRIPGAERGAWLNTLKRSATAQKYFQIGPCSFQVRSGCLLMYVSVFTQRDLLHTQPKLSTQMGNAALNWKYLALNSCTCKTIKPKENEATRVSCQRSGIEGERAARASDPVSRYFTSNTMFKKLSSHVQVLTSTPLLCSKPFTGSFNKTTFKIFSCL